MNNVSTKFVKVKVSDLRFGDWILVPAIDGFRIVEVDSTSAGELVFIPGSNYPIAYAIGEVGYAHKQVFN